MKKFFPAALIVLLLMTGCSSPVTARTWLEAQSVDPAALAFSACLIHEDGSTETVALDGAAQQALLSSFDSAEQVTEDAVTAEQAGSHHLIWEDWTLYVDASGSRLTFVHPAQNQGEPLLMQAHFTLAEPLPVDLFPAAQSAQAPRTMTTLDDRLSTADISLLEAEGQLLEFAPFPQSVPGNPKGNAYAVLQEGSLILGAQKMSLEGEYLPMLVQEVELVNSTLIVRVAVSSAEESGAVSLSAPDTVSEVWFVESGTIMEIADVTSAE